MGRKLTGTRSVVIRDARYIDIESHGMLIMTLVPEELEIIVELAKERGLII